MPLLTIHHLTRHFGGVVALEEVSFSLAPREIVGLIGPNGAGKTTLFHCLTGVLRPERGSIRFGQRDQEELVGLLPHQVIQCGIARTFQNSRLFANMTTVENVLVGTYIRTHTGLLGAVLRSREAHREERWAVDHAMRLIGWLGLSPYADQVAASLPYGVQRRLEMARALASEPELLLLDEPAAGLNATEKGELLRLIAELRQRGLTILFIEHDMQVVMPISDRVVVLDHGQKIAEGPSSAIQRDPRVIEAYLGCPLPRAGSGDPRRVL